MPSATKISGTQLTRAIRLQPAASSRLLWTPSPGEARHRYGGKQATSASSTVTFQPARSEAEEVLQGRALRERHEWSIRSPSFPTPRLLTRSPSCVAHRSPGTFPWSSAVGRPESPQKLLGIQTNRDVRFADDPAPAGDGPRDPQGGAGRRGGEPRRGPPAPAYSPHRGNWRWSSTMRQRLRPGSSPSRIPRPGDHASQRCEGHRAGACASPARHHGGRQGFERAEMHLMAAGIRRCLVVDTAHGRISERPWSSPSSGQASARPARSR